ncbi:MAG: hypothetical protein FWF67_02040 [Fibromonadales bacterium]|nr:hypothetical protein [Fibromonadales bacterium]
MQEISVKSVKDGMVLAEPLENMHGSLILDKGTVLTEAFAARLAARGIQTVCIEGESEEKNISKLQTSQASGSQEITLDKLFKGKIVNNSMNIIYEALARYKNSNG